jgi:hypothetical protein
MRVPKEHEMERQSMRALGGMPPRRSPPRLRLHPRQSHAPARNSNSNTATTTTANQQNKSAAAASTKNSRPRAATPTTKDRGPSATTNTREDSRTRSNGKEEVAARLITYAHSPNQS